MDINEYKLYNDLSLLGEVTEYNYDNNVVNDILNSSAFYNDTSLDLSELIPDLQKEAFGLHFSSNTLTSEFSLNTMTPSSAISCLKQIPSACSGEFKRNVNDNFQLDLSNSRHDYPEPSSCPTRSLNRSNVNGSSNEFLEETLYPLLVDSDKIDPFFEPAKVRIPNKEFNSTISNLSDIKNEIKETSQDLGFTSYHISRNNSTLTKSLPMNTKLNPDNQVPKTVLPLAHDYKGLLPTEKCNGERTLKKNCYVGTNIVIKKKNSTFIQSLKESTTSHKMDDKIYKKYQRMIKNRESASLSRKKRKEYVVSLETRINKLEKECDSLKAENITLRDQLYMFATSGQCESGNANGILHNYLGSERTENKNGRFTSKAKHCNKNNTTATIKKNVAILFAMAFVVSLNAGNFQKYLNIPNNFEGGSEIEPVGKQLSMSNRRLLWADSEEEYKEKNNLSTFLSDKQKEPSLYFLSSGIRNQKINSLDNITKNVSHTYSYNEPPPLTYLSTRNCINRCRSLNNSSNQSKYFMLAQNLHKWISGTLNISNFSKEKEDSNGFEFFNKYFEEKRDIHIKHEKQKMFIDLNDYTSVLPEKRRKLNNTKSFENMREQINVISKIKRRDDTFYVFSFNMDHALLPALSYNSSYRPKLSLVLPLENPGINGKMKMIQVDCEVFNTKDFEVSHHLLPAKLRQNISTRKLNKLNIKKGSTETPVSKTQRVRNFYKVGSRNQATVASSFNKETKINNN
ncbi:uncharacterized protein LOC6620142 isoform X1 [Drosophila sechellia]|uniref:GM26735 n=1 Tax=Drosophila sechellia TaxID=7238 RepID=B4IKU5_DROSE|nr:uncharacterized protein LOC6620142 isoform X1 [Drosophila sechellia]EDW52703.1 GM26735 [Drosophila sechellia]